MSAEPNNTIPIVDLGQLGVGVAGGASDAEYQRVAKALGAALGGIGFVYLKNHGIPNEQIEAVFSCADKFFNLEEEKKLKYEKKQLSLSHGYVAIDREKLDPKAGHFELRESFYIKNLSYQLPDEEVPEMREALQPFYASCTALVSTLLTAMAIAIDLDRDFFTSNHDEMFRNGNTMTVMRLNRYPAVPADVPPNTTRCGAHTDYGTITLLFQDDMGGLQVYTADNKWLEARPIPGTIVVNIGDLLHYWTAGRYVATKHRVVIPAEEVRRRVPRQSIALFLHPNSDTLVKPLDGSDAYQPIKAEEHLLQRYNQTYTY